MGFLDRVVKRGIENAVSDVRRSATNAAGNAISNAIEDSVNDKFNKLFGTDAKRSTGSSAPAESPSAAATPAAEAPAFSGEYKVVKLKVSHNESFTPDANAVGSTIGDRGSAAYFADVISKNIPGAAVRTNVALSEISSENPDKKVNIDVLVSIGGVNKVAIVLPSKAKYRNHAYLNTMNACEAAGVAALRFMQEFRNDPGYVSARVKSVIK